MNFIKELFLFLSVLFLFCLKPFYASACSVKIGSFDWDSSNIHSAIATYILENGYGCDTQVTKGRTNPILALLIDNKIDIIFEHWTDNNVALINPELSSGNLVDLGINTPASEQAFFIDRATSETYGISSVEDLKKSKIWELFKDPEDPSKGRIISCIFGWTCYTINYVKIMEYGLGDLYNMYDPGTAQGLDKIILDAFANNKPIITYYYTPTSLMGKPEIDMVRLSEPAYDKACWESMMAVVNNIKIYGTSAYETSCANEYKDMALTKLATGDFYNSNPNIISFVNAYTITTSVVNNLLAYYVDISDGNLEETAKYYLKNYSEWEVWVPSNIASKIKNTL